MSDSTHIGTGVPPDNGFAMLSGMGRNGAAWRSSSLLQPSSLPLKQAELLEVLALATQEKLDAGVVVSQFSKEHIGAYRRTLRRLAKRLGGEGTLYSALEQTPDALNDDDVLAIRCGSNLGMLPSTFDSLLRSQREGKDQWIQKGSNRTYYVVLAMAIAMLVLMMGAFIAPTMAKMSSELEVPTTSAFYWFRATFRWFFDNFTWVVTGGVVLGFLLRSSFFRRFVRKRISSGTSLFQSRAKSSGVLRVLAIASVSDRPISSATSTLAKYHYDRATRQRLLLARNEMEQGENEWTSLVKAKVLSESEAELLRMVPNPKSLAWTLEQLATNRESVSHNRKVFLHAFVHPIVMIVFGLIVLWVCVAFFSIIPSTIKSLTS
jgi:type II secretory pathway component PulF